MLIRITLLGRNSICAWTFNGEWKFNIFCRYRNDHFDERDFVFYYIRYSHLVSTKAWNARRNAHLPVGNSSICSYSVKHLNYNVNTINPFIYELITGEKKLNLTLDIKQNHLTHRRTSSVRLTTITTRWTLDL